VQAWSTLFGQRATRVVTTDAHEGQSVLRLQARQTVFQRVDLPPMHPAYRLEFQAWTRPAPDDPAGQGWARIDAGSIPISQTEGLLAGSQIWPGWQPITATAVISPDIPFVNCELGADGAAEFDDVVLLAYPLAAPGRPPATAVAVPLRNPSMEDAGVQLQPDTLLGWLVAHMPTTLQAGLILDTLANPQPFDKTAVAGSYLENAAKSYWGWFGWLSVPLELPAWQYWLWLGLTLAALAGGIGAIVTRPHPKTAQIALVLVSLGALGIAAGAVGARQMMQLAQYGLRDFPQGRHLFVLSLPTTWLLLGGLAWWPSWLARRLPPVARRHTTLLMRTMGWLGLLLLLYLDLYALIVLLIPYYYGRF
jgi:hypothetical protein